MSFVIYTGLCLKEIYYIAGRDFMDERKRVVNIGDVDIPYDVVINKKLKYMRISIGINGMRVSVNRKVDAKDIEKFLKSKEKWILKHYTRFQSIKAKEISREWNGTEKVLLKGNEYSVFIHNCQGDDIIVKFDGIKFQVQAGTDLSGDDRKRSIEIALKKVFVKIARETINERLSFYSRIIGVTYNDVRIKEQKTRWGSCSKKGNLNFNWRIIMAPPWVTDYVIIHELCHLRFLDHSKRYWSMVESYMPDYKKARQWLKENGAKLKI